MKSSPLYGYFILSCLFILAVSCSEPRVSETFVPFEKTDSLGRYCFELELTDSTVLYDLSFYSRIDCTRSQFCQIREFPLEVTMVSPSAVEYSELVYIPVSAFGPGDGPDYVFYEKYRSGLVPVEYGVWKMSVKVPDIKGMRGLGLVVEKKQ